MKAYLMIGLIGFLSLHAAVPATSETATLSASISKDDKELAWVDEQIKAILPSRVGISDGAINALRDPMKLTKPAPKTGPGGTLLAPPKLGTTLLPPKPVVVEEPLRLKAMMNKSVLISGKWYKVGDTVRSYSLAEIKPNSVLLVDKKGHKLILFLTKPNNKIQITTK